MKTINLTNPLNVPYTKAKEAQLHPVTLKGLTLIKEETLITLNNQPALYYKPDAFDHTPYANHFKNHTTPPKTQTTITKRINPLSGAPSGTQRLSGIVVPSETYGYIDALPARRRYSAAPCVSNKTHPGTWNALKHLLNAIKPIWQLQYPYGDHQNQIYKTWKINDSPFTSCIQNFSTAAYPHHKDSGNIPGSWSIMPVVRGLTTENSGGNLTIPELGVALECAAGSVASFQGGKWWHGVTKIVGDRWSIVYYAKKGLTKAAETQKQEIKNGNQQRTEYEIQGSDTII